MRKKSRQGYSIFSKMTGFAIKTAVSTAKAVNREIAAQQRQVEKIQRQNLREQQRINQGKFILEQNAQGFEYVTTRSLEKYITRGILVGDELDTLRNAALDGVKRVFIHRDRLDELESKLKEYKKSSRS